MCEHGLSAILLDSRHLAYRLLDLWGHLLIPGNGNVQRGIRIHNSLAHQVAFCSVSRVKGPNSLKLYVGKIKLATEPDQISVAIRAD
jgi:hypothetical protein